MTQENTVFHGKNRMNDDIVDLDVAGSSPVTHPLF
jgi:hypothetical protein